MLHGIGATNAVSGRRNRASHSATGFSSSCDVSDHVDVLVLRDKAAPAAGAWALLSRRRNLSISDHKARIRERAYKLWEENGCPHGREAELWEQAEDLVGMEENPEAGLLPNPSKGDPALTGVEEAEVQENYGEIPGRLTDQGDRPQTPAKQNREQAAKDRTDSLLGRQ